MGKQIESLNPKESAKESTDAQLTNLKEDVDTSTEFTEAELDEAITQLHDGLDTQKFTKEDLQDVMERIRNGIITQTINAQSFQDSLKNNFESSDGEDFLTYLEEFLALTTEYKEQLGEEDILLMDDLSILETILEAILDDKYSQITLHNKERSKKFYTPEINEFISDIEDEIQEEADKLYTDLQITDSRFDPAKILELGIRRERSILNADDKWQGLIAKHAPNTPKLETFSLPPIGVKGETYLQALLYERGVFTNPDQLNAGYNWQRRLALAMGIVENMENMYQQIMDPSTSAKTYASILKMNTPKKDEEITVTLFGSQKYKLRKQEYYTFTDDISGETIRYSHDEMRLLEGLSNYMGKGLMFGTKTKDAEVIADADGKITLKEDQTISMLAVDVLNEAV